MARRLYRWLLRIFPRSFLDEFGTEMEMHFEETLADARERGESRFLLWLHAARDALVEGLAERTVTMQLPTRKGGVLEISMRNTRFAIRSLALDPVFSLVVLLTLALGIGATTSVFSVLYGVLFAPLPYPKSERLVRLFEQAPGVAEFPLSPGNFLDYRAATQTFGGVAIFYRADAELTAGVRSERLLGMRVSHGFFDVLGFAPVVGRSFSKEAESLGQDRVVLLSERFWERRFARDPRLVGSSIVLDGEPHDVLGIVPRALTHVGGSYHSLPHGTTVDVYRPYAFAAEPRRGAHFLNGIGRLRPGVTMEQASIEVNAIAERLEREFPDSNEGWRVALVPLHEEIVRNARPTLLVLAGSVLCVLLVAAVNVAGLLLGRGQARLKDVALRSALGAGRGRLVAELLVESALLGIAGGFAGVLFAAAFVTVLPSFAPEGLPRLESIELDGNVLAFSLAITLAVAFLSGIVPALRLSRVSLGLARPRASGDVWDRRVRSTFVVTQIALAVALLVGASLLLRTLLNLTRAEPGFRPENVVTAHLYLPRARYGDGPSASRFFVELIERLKDIPGVVAAGAGSDLPWTGYDENIAVSVEGRLPDERFGTRYHFILPGYFESLGVPLVFGRTFSRDDDESSPKRVVINRALANRIFGEADPTGARLSFTREPTEADWMTIVGVVGDIKDTPGADRAEEALYMAYPQIPWNSDLFLTVRTERDSEAVLERIREEVAKLDRDLPLVEVRRLEEVTEQAMSGSRFVSGFAGAFATTALSLALLGLYGMVAHAVGRDTKAIAIRMALGARGSDVLLKLLAWVFRLVLLGTALGVVGSHLLSRSLQGFLYEVTASDGLTLVGVTILFAITAVAATIAPVRRAIRIEPTLALRHE